MGPQSLLPMIRLTEFHPFGCHICPDVSETCCGAGEDLAGEDLAECLGVLQVPIQFGDGLQPGMYPYLEDRSLDLPRRLGRLCDGTSLCLWHPGDALNLHLLLLRRRALKPSSWTRFTPQKKSPDPPRGFFGDSSLSSLCGPVGFRGVAPHHGPIHPELCHQRFHMDRFPMGRICYRFRVLCFGLTTATHVFTRLLAPRFTILHRYVVGML